MRYTQLRSFHAVATAGGFNAAAEAFHSSQPTLTTQVGALEAEYGLELFIKKGRRRELTNAGRQLLAITARLFAEEEEAIAFLEQSRELKHGKLSIGAVGPYHVTEMLAAFNRAYPGIELAVKLGNSTEVLSDLLEYKSDIELESVPYQMARWVVSMEGKEALEIFKNENRSSLAEDREGRLVYFARNAWDLDNTAKRYPAMVFRDTCELAY